MVMRIMVLTELRVGAKGPISTIVELTSTNAQIMDRKPDRNV